MLDKIIILDFGSQYTQLIARRVRELEVYCEIYPFNQLPELTSDVKGLILSGSPSSVSDDQGPSLDVNNFLGKIPSLGICYGAQMVAKQLGGEVLASSIREYGRAVLGETSQSDLLKAVDPGSHVWMSHGDTILKIPENFEVIASTESVKVAAYRNIEKKVYGLQFHPEVTHTDKGKELLRNFVIDICGCDQKWTPESYIESAIKEIKEKIGDDQVVMGLSGGVDSSVAATLIHQAIGVRLHCIFVNNGLLRKNEYEEVLESYKHAGLNVKGIDASRKFYKDLGGVIDPEEKRKIIGRNFIHVFEEEAEKIENVKWLGQGTIYPDVIESVSVNGPSVTIKSHHNVGGLPDIMKLKVIEPLKSLFKDEVRKVGRTLGLEAVIIGRHPFPGPGLGIRILGDVTEDKVRLLQEVDDIFIQGLKKEGLYDKIWQAGAVLTPLQSVGVMGDERTYENLVALRAVTSVDGMTADWYRLPYDFLSNISNKIINQVKGVNRVVYDISSKPPSTIEWE
ncbi:MAG TPA: glutamine-hydrolyzing GMP synthase [Cyclobacteriaceae bacterium]